MCLGFGLDYVLGCDGVLGFGRFRVWVLVLKNDLVRVGESKSRFQLRKPVKSNEFGFFDSVFWLRVINRFSISVKSVSLVDCRKKI